MATQESDGPIIESTPIEEVDTLEYIESLARDSSEDADEVLIVHSSELIEPLSAEDLIDLDYDEELPTRVDGRRREQHRETYPPPRTDAADVFYLTDGRASRTPEGRISSLLDAPRLPTLPMVHPPPVREIASPRSSTASSIAPVAVSNDEDSKVVPLPIEPVSGRGLYGSVIVVLAAAAAAIALWPEPSGVQAPAVQTPAIQTLARPAAAALAKAPAAHTAEDTEEAVPVVHQLDEIDVIADLPRFGAEPKAVAAEPAARPSGNDVVIDDAAQLEGKVFPSTPAADEEVSSEAITPPEPPANDPLPFDRSAAAAAMNAAAASAKSCRAEGAPQSTARVSVTFAPSGRVTTAIVDGPRLSGTPEGGCVARTFRSLRVDPFSGPPVTVHGTFPF